MGKKPPLEIVSDLTSTPPRPPRQLGPSGLAVWRKVQTEYAIHDCGGIEVLMQICAAQDRLGQIAGEIEQQGVTIRTRAGMRANPLIREELALRAFICKTLQRLGVTDEPTRANGRPPQPGGWAGHE